MPDTDKIQELGVLPRTPIGLTLSIEELLAVGAVLRTMDADLLEDEGILPGLDQRVETAFRKVDTQLTTLFGPTWPELVVTPERLAEDAEPDNEVEENR